MSEYDPGHGHHTQPVKASDRRVGRPGRPQLLQIVIERETLPESHAATCNTLRDKMNKGRKKIKIVVVFHRKHDHFYLNVTFSKNKLMLIP